jgi:hypothetical protein
VSEGGRGDQHPTHGLEATIERTVSADVPNRGGGHGALMIRPAPP